MSHIMQMLGVRSSAEWKAEAECRSLDSDAQAITNRRHASGQMLAMLASTDFTPDDDFLNDAELLISGRMSHDEYRAYLAQKHKEQD